MLTLICSVLNILVAFIQNKSGTEKTTLGDWKEKNDEADTASYLLEFEYT
jgi:hypothetical protein